MNSPFKRLQETASQTSDRLTETGERIAEAFSNSLALLVGIGVVAVVALVVALVAVKRGG